MNANRETVVAIVSACQQRGMAFNMLKDRALTDPGAFDALVEDCRVYLAQMFQLDPASKAATLSAMQTAKVTGASALYGYTTRLRQMIRAGKMAEIADLKASDCMKAKPKAPKAPGEPEAPKSAAPSATVDDLISTLQALHAARGLSDAHYEALALIVKPATVTPMAPRVDTLALAA
jgi:hypothetical protein